MKLKEWLSGNRKIYSNTDLRYLIKSTLGKDMPIALCQDICLDKEIIERLGVVTAAYVQGMPLAYILGKEEFFGFTFCVDRCTLIPRKETELIVEKAIEIIKNNNVLSVLDLCCGCANISIAIDKSINKKVDIFSSDISFEALEVSLQNKRINSSRTKLVNSDLLNAFKEDAFDLIVSNPPYVQSQQVKGSLCYEPQRALDAGFDGLDYITRILDEAYKHLKNKGYLIMEFGYRHRRAIEEKVLSKGCYEIKEWIKDYSGHFRGVVLEKNAIRDTRYAIRKYG